MNFYPWRGTTIFSECLPFFPIMDSYWRRFVVIWLSPCRHAITNKKSQPQQYHLTTCPKQVMDVPRNCSGWCCWGWLWLLIKFGNLAPVIFASGGCQILLMISFYTIRNIQQTFYFVEPGSLKNHLAEHGFVFVLRKVLQKNPASPD